MTPSNTSGQATLLPWVAEKALHGASHGVYTFRVGKRDAKPAIKQAVEERYGVHVVTVRTTFMPAKQRRRGPARRKGLRPGFKKAMVQLTKGETIKELEG